jgi:hypothetical protein
MVRNALIPILTCEDYEVLEADGIAEAMKLLSMFDGVNLIIADSSRVSSSERRPFPEQLLNSGSGSRFFEIGAPLRENLEQYLTLMTEGGSNDLTTAVNRLLERPETRMGKKIGVADSPVNRRRTEQM